MGRPFEKAEGLTGAGPGYNEDRPIERVDGLLLLKIRALSQRSTFVVRVIFRAIRAGGIGILRLADELHVPA